MPSEIIKKLIESENRSEEREKSARAEANSIIDNAKLRAEEIIKNAEQESKNMLAEAENQALSAARQLKEERKANTDDVIASLGKSAESKSSRVLDELIKILS